MNSTITTGTDYRYTGKELDEESGFNLYYYGARFYDARIGRFVSVDPRAENSPDLTPYHYTANNPIKLFDPTGEEEITVVIRSFIPSSSVGPFLGDKRGFTAPPSGTSRTSQTVVAETDPNISKDPSLSSSSETGPTIATGPFLWGVGHSKGDFSSDVKRTGENFGNNAAINVSGSASNPFFGGLAPAIDYNFQIKLTPGKDPVVTGKHDGYPAYEVWTKGADGKWKQAYGYTPKNFLDVRKLIGKGDIPVKPKKKSNGNEPNKADHPDPQKEEDLSKDPYPEN